MTAAAAGALIGAAALTGAYLLRSSLTFDMDAPLPSFVTGIYSGERDVSGTFAWTSERAAIDIRDLDRHSGWSCTIRYRGPRPEGVAPPAVDVTLDDRRVASVTAGGEYQDLEFAVPRGPRGMHVVLTVTPAFVPGTADRRVLGVQIDRLQCRPNGMAWPPGWALLQAGASAALVGGLFVLAGFSMLTALLCALVVAWGAAIMLTTAGGVYTDYSNTILQITVWIMALVTIAVSVTQKARARALSTEARWAIAVSVVALLVKLIGLMHPAKPVIDAVFHAHRLEMVVAGTYHFTQPFVGGVQMPYAIGLYVFAWPWTWIVHDHVALIRTVAAASDVVAALLLYPVVMRAWDDRRAAALAVLAFQLAPLPYAVLGNANLTNMFGQSVALVAVLAAVSWRLSLRRPISLAAFTALVTLAFCSHVSTITMLLAVLGVLAILYIWRGDTGTRAAAIAIAVASAAALVASWLLYYRNFSEEIAGAFSRMFSGGAAGALAAPAAEAAKGYMSRGDRLKDLVLQAWASAGAPLMILGFIGVWSLWRRRRRDRLVSALLAWTAMWLVFSASTVFSRVDPEFVRYTAEFLGRINLAVIPLVAIAAGRGAAAGWDDATPPGARSLLKLATLALVTWAIVIAAQVLPGWFNR